jgi:hypothetical protein
MLTNEQVRMIRVVRRTIRIASRLEDAGMTRWQAALLAAEAAKRVEWDA